MTPSAVLAVIAASDCEGIGSGLIAQPFNTVTSLAYVVAGVWIIVRRRVWHLDRSATVFGVLVAACGVGSVAYHAAADARGRWLHDLSLLTALAFVAGWHVALLRRNGAASAGVVATAAAAVALVVMGVVLVIEPDATNGVLVVLVVVALVASVIGRIRTRTRPAWSDLPFIAVAAAAALAFVLGRTNSPVCDEDSIFQFHGIWHIATAVLALVWARAALAVSSRGEGAAREGTDHFIAAVAGVVVHGFFRDVTVEGRSRVPDDGPVLIVINHFNGLVDPVVAVHALGRLPRFIAKATLWNVTLARPFLALAGLIPVYRTVDQSVDNRDAGAGNRSAFSACHDVLAKGGTVAIFPEGTTSARSQLAPVKTGAARIALGAYAAGVKDLIIVPVGLAFEDRVAFRGRAFVDVGPPIRMADALPRVASDGFTASEDDHAAVDRLTAEIDAHLRACAPNYDTPREEAVLQMAAKVALRPDGIAEHEPSFGEVERTARRLARTSTADRQEVETAVADYALDLRLGQLSDAEITPGPGLIGRLRKAVTALVLILVFSPLIVIGLAANVIPYLIVRLASRRVRVPVTKGTVRMLVGIAVFPITWIVLSVLLADHWEAVGLFLLFAISGFAGLWALEAAWLNARTVMAWRAARGERRWFAEQLREHRARLATTVQRAMAGVPDASEVPGASDGPEDVSRSGVGTGSGVGHDE
jgi:1-acyl-sn-glycerol-3-phosphate acyltransferase